VPGGLTVPGGLKALPQVPDQPAAMPIGSSRDSSTWLSATSQRWKIAIFGVLMAISGALLVTLVLAENDVALASRFSIVKLGLGQVAFAMLAFTWLLRSVRCPVCRRSFAWAFISRGDHATWWLRMSAAASCPWCEERAHSGIDGKRRIPAQASPANGSRRAVTSPK
jgi:hypothetical protein